MGDGTVIYRRTEVQVLLLLCENNYTVPNILMLPIAIDDAERWTLQSQEIQALDVFEMHCHSLMAMLQGQTECETARSEKRRSPMNLYQMSSDIEDSSGLDTCVRQMAAK